MWGGARGASRLQHPDLPDLSARISVKKFDRILTAKRGDVVTKIVSGGIPPGMEGVWTEYQNLGYDTQRLVRDDKWKERGVDHTIIGHMWRLLAKHRNETSLLILASGDGQENEFGTSFFEVLDEILIKEENSSWQVCVASFDWEYPNSAKLRSPTSSRVKKLVENSTRGSFINLFDHYNEVVFHKEWLPVKPATAAS
jgi:hypothetical protein